MPSSIYSCASGRSVSSLASTLTERSKGPMAVNRKLKLKWWQRRPILKSAYLLDLQKGSYAAILFAIIESVILMILSLFDLFCLLVAHPGSRYFRSFGFSFLFVYSGNRYVRYALISTSSLMIIQALFLLTASCHIIPSLKKEREREFKPWICVMTMFVWFKTVATIFQSLANDLYFTYHQTMLLIWFFLVPINTYALLVVYSNYQELSDITKIEDMAKIKMSTLSSLQGSRSFSHMSNQSLDSIYKMQHYSALINSNPSPLYMRATANIVHQPHSGIAQTTNSSLVYGNHANTNAASILYCGAGDKSILSTPAQSVLTHHVTTPSLRDGAEYTIPLEMFNLNRTTGADLSLNQDQINQEYI